jgi:hypothetical protein
MEKLITIILCIILFYSCSNNNDSSANIQEKVTIPLAPSNLNYTIRPSKTIPAGNATLNLTWTDNSNNETEFRIQHKGEFSQDWTGDGQDATSNNYYSKPIPTFLYSNNHRYYLQDQYRVYARNSAGKSEYSNVITIEKITFPNGLCTHCVP